MNDKASSVQMGEIHRITELLRLEGTYSDHLVQTLKAKSAEAFAQDLVQSVLNILKSQDKFSGSLHKFSSPRKI